MNLKLVMCVAVAIAGNSLAAKTLNVLDYGAKGDGNTVDTAAVQRAIDAAGRGDTVLAPRKHTFLVATLNLKGDMEFRFDGTLLISTNQSDYSGNGVLMASNAPNLTICGKGKLLGQSLSFMTGYDALNEWWLFKEWRPTMFLLTGCTNLVVRDITFGDAPYWGLHMLGCENVLVENITVKNRLDVPNCDGIDPDHCRRVEIRDCNLTCGDDAIVIKATRQTNDFGHASNIYVHDCDIITQDAGLKIGTETTSDIHDILFEDCTIRTSSRGLCIQLRDEGSVSNIVFRDIELVSRFHSDPWWGRGEAISFTAIPRTPSTKVGKLQDVLVENVSGTAENSIRINGCSDSVIEGVCLKDISMKFSRWTKYVGGVYDNRPTKALPPIEPHPSDGINLRHVQDVSLKNCSINWGRDPMNNFGGALVAENATGLHIINFQGASEAHAITIH